MDGREIYLVRCRVVARDFAQGASAVQLGSAPPPAVPRRCEFSLPWQDPDVRTLLALKSRQPFSGLSLTRRRRLLSGSQKVFVVEMAAEDISVLRKHFMDFETSSSCASVGKTCCQTSQAY